MELSKLLAVAIALLAAGPRASSSVQVSHEFDSALRPQSPDYDLSQAPVVCAGLRMLGTEQQRWLWPPPGASSAGCSNLGCWGAM